MALLVLRGYGNSTAAGGLSDRNSLCTVCGLEPQARVRAARPPPGPLSRARGRRPLSRSSCGRPLCVCVPISLTPVTRIGVTRVTPFTLITSVKTLSPHTVPSEILRSELGHRDLGDTVEPMTVTEPRVLGGGSLCSAHTGPGCGMSLVHPRHHSVQVKTLLCA